MPQAPDGHHPRPRRGQQPVEQQPGQREVAEVVGPELQLEAVGGELTFGEHHAGVVDEQVDPVVRVAQRVGGRADRRERGEIQPLDLESRLGRRSTGCRRPRPRRLEAADRQHHRRAVGGELPGRLQAQTRSSRRSRPPPDRSGPGCRPRSTRRPLIVLFPSVGRQGKSPGRAGGNSRRSARSRLSAARPRSSPPAPSDGPSTTVGPTSPAGRAAPRPLAHPGCGTASASTSLAS